MSDVTEALLIYVRRTGFPAWMVLDEMRRQRFSEFEALTALLLAVQDHRIGCDYRGRLCVPSTRLEHEALIG